MLTSRLTAARGSWNYPEAPIEMAESETPTTENNSSPLLDRSIESREKFWKRYGTLDTGVMTSLNNPLLQGGPKWPSLRQAFLKVDRSHSVLLASDGLSDPFLGGDDQKQGFGVEFFMESRDKDLKGRSWESLKTTWMFHALYMVAQNAAYAGNFRELLDENGVVSIELKNVKAPEAFLSDEGLVGVLIGVEPKNISSELKLPISKIRLASVVLLTREELQFSIREGLAGRKKLNKLFRKKGMHHFSSVDRDAVVK